MRKAVAARPVLLNYRPDTIAGKVQELAQLLKLPKEDVAEFSVVRFACTAASLYLWMAK